MKKFFLMLLALTLALSTLTVFAEDVIIPSPGAGDIVDEPILFEGFVLEVKEGSLLVQTSFDALYEVLLTEETILEGKEIAVGDYINVVYDGTMTFSIPAQIKAIHIGNYMLMGLVSELNENGFTLTFGEEIYQVNATVELLEGICDGMFVTVYHKGMMTRSIPAQITAMVVRDYMLMGIVSELTDNGFVLTFGEEVYAVNADAAQLAGIQDGMFVTVYHNGMMTRMIPAGVTASHVRGQEIVGTVTEMVEGGFTLTVEGEELPYHVAIKEDALQFVQAEPGMEVIVIIDGLQTASLESILVNATEILPLPVVQEVFDMAGIITEIGEGFIMIENADGQPVQVNLSEETLFEGKDVAVHS